MMAPQAITHALAIVAKQGAKGLALVALFMLAQWQFFGAELADHERRIQALETRVMTSYHNNGTLWLRNQCVEMRTNETPIPPGACDEVFRQIEEETNGKQRIW